MNKKELSYYYNMLRDKFFIKKDMHSIVPKGIIDVYNRWAASSKKRGAKAYLGRSKRFGYFIVVMMSDDIQMVYAERGNAQRDFALDLLNAEESLDVKDGKVSRHTRREKSTGEKDYSPRIYIDGSILFDAGYDYDDPITISVNKATGEIRITPKELS